MNEKNTVPVAFRICSFSSIVSWRWRWSWTFKLAWAKMFRLRLRNTEYSCMKLDHRGTRYQCCGAGPAIFRMGARAGAGADFVVGRSREPDPS